ncbi:hypothetical protein T05_3208, partial [Trichinella murrelli]
MFSYRQYYGPYMGLHEPCKPLTQCHHTYGSEDVPPVLYYENGRFYPISHCSVLTKDIVEIPSVLIFSHARIPRR